MIPGAFGGSVQVHTDCIDVQQNFDDSILNVIESSMATVHSLMDENECQTSSGQGRQNETNEVGQMDKNQGTKGQSQNVSNGNISLNGDIQKPYHPTGCSLEDQSPRRARKTFPVPLPPIVRRKKQSVAISRRIHELEMQRDKYLQQNQIYEEEILKLSQQLQKNGAVCATCGTYLDEPYFCNKECQMKFN